jgi:hypothetical protein
MKNLLTGGTLEPARFSDETGDRTGGRQPLRWRCLGFGSMSVRPVERRSPVDRRVRRVSLRFPERRTGFDRRVPSASGARRASWRVLQRYRDAPRGVALVLALVVVLSVLDLLFTMRALHLGATELNPVMGALLGSSPAAAGIFKVVVTLVVAGGIWRLRRYRRVLEASLFLLVGLSALAAYHIGNLLPVY